MNKKAAVKICQAAFALLCVFLFIQSAFAGETLSEGWCRENRFKNGNYTVDIGVRGEIFIYLDEVKNENLLLVPLSSVALRKDWNQGSSGDGIYYREKEGFIIESVDAKAKDTPDGRRYIITGKSKLGVTFAYQVNCGPEKIEIEAILEGGDLSVSDYMCAYVQVDMRAGLFPEEKEYKVYTRGGKELQGKIRGEPYYSWAQAISGAQKLVVENVAGRNVSIELPKNEQTYFRSNSPEEITAQPNDNAAFLLVRGEPATASFVKGSTANFNIIVNISRK